MSKITIKANNCPICLGQLTYEPIGSYGTLYNVSKKTGKPLKRRLRRVHYETEYELLYCMRCKRNFNFKWKDDALYLLHETDDEG